jgi:hypothetical protein
MRALEWSQRQDIEFGLIEIINIDNQSHYFEFSYLPLDFDSVSSYRRAYITLVHAQRLGNVICEIRSSLHAYQRLEVL